MLLNQFRTSFVFFHWLTPVACTTFVLILSRICLLILPIPNFDKIPKVLRSCVVYSFKCRCCSASYLGQTVRHLHTRVSEHLGFSALTGRKSCSPVMSSILLHLNSTGHTASLDDFQILSSCSSPDELLVRESLLISKYKPSLNIQGSSVPLLLL